MAPRWKLFAGVTILVVLAFLSLARASEDAIEQGKNGRTAGGVDGESIPESGAEPAHWEGQELLVGVTLSQLLVGLPLVGIAWYAELPVAALGVGGSVASAAPMGVAIGIVVYLLSEGASAVAKRLGIDTDEQLRGLLAPESPRGWILLLCVALPIVALVEEFIFRAALVGAVSVGFGIPSWLLAFVSSVAFGLGHGVQGGGGVLVAGALGFVLAGAFVLTGSLAVVVVAHYVVNALEFVVHEGFGIEWVP